MKHGAFNVRVFGSVSRGEETETSDIDLVFLRRVSIVTRTKLLALGYKYA
jgi:predicted nucleotidyltransferase